MISAASLLITNGTFTQNLVTSSRGFEMLTQRVATQALHDSGQVSDPAKCHPDTRVAILTDLQEWADGIAYDYTMKWISGSAGVGKTAIMRTTAETLERKKLLLACFFFWRTAERCNTADFLIATLAYQIAISIPETRPHIERIIEEKPHIFTQTLEVQSRALIVDPITTVYREEVLPWNNPRIFVIDGLDECFMASTQSQDTNKQCEVLRTLHWTLQQLPANFKLLIASRPEYHIQAMFNTSLKDVVSPLWLNDSSDTAADIDKFYVDKFREIRACHPLRSFLPSSEWPSREALEALVRNASGQFIYASTVIKFVSASKKHPSNQLNAILEANIPPNMYPFQPLDVLYSTILSVIDNEDFRLTLRILGALWITRGYKRSPMLWNNLFGLPHGEIQRLLLGLESLLLVRGESSDASIHFYHASLGDFLFDAERSGNFFIDRTLVFEDLVKQGIFHLLINPSDDGDLTDFILHQIKVWFEGVNPSVELLKVIEQAGSSVRPRDLKMRYPMFLSAIRRSKLPGKEELYYTKLDLYRSHLKRVLPPYFTDGALSLLLFTRLMIEFRDYQHFMINGFNGLEEFVDDICDLSPDLRQIDRDQGLYLYGDLRDRGERRRSTTSTFGIFRDSAGEVIGTMANIGDQYAKVCSCLVRYLSDLTRYPIEASPSQVPATVSLAPDLLVESLRRASPGSDLINCLVKYPIFRDDVATRAGLQENINYYLERYKPLAKTELTLEPNSKLGGNSLVNLQLWTGIWAGWANCNAGKIGQAVDQMQYILDIDE